MQLVAVAAVAATLWALPGTANATPATHALAAPKPTSTAASPEAPDPHPPAGGKAPDGSVPGGAALASRGLLVGKGAPRLPAQLTARAWVLADLDTGQILAARDPHGRYQPASILKALTAVTVLPHLPGSRVVRISQSAATAEGSAVGLLAGGRYTIDQLFAALLLVSGNDAAQALAEANGGVARTVDEMNSEAAALGAYDTFVQTPSGLDGWQQLTSAYDMTLVLRAALADARFVHYDRLPQATFPAQASRFGKVGLYQFDNQSLNFLREVPGALVAKTGYTDAALHTYVCAAQRGSRRLGVVFLRNQRLPLDQYQQAAALLGWGFRLPRTVEPVGVLAGPIQPAGSGAQAPAASDGLQPGSQPPAPQASNSPVRRHGSAPAASSAPTRAQAARLTGGVLALGVACAAGLRLKRRRSLRRY